MVQKPYPAICEGKQWVSPMTLGLYCLGGYDADRVYCRISNESSRLFSRAWGLHGTVK